MRKYFVQAKKLEFGDNKVEESLGKFGLKIRAIATTDNERTLMYETERQRKLTPKQMDKIESNSLVNVIVAEY